MTADEERDARSLPDDALMATFILSVRVGAEEPFSGSVGAVDPPAAVQFHGWIEFMGAMNRLRAEAVGRGG